MSRGADFRFGHAEFVKSLARKAAQIVFSTVNGRNQIRLTLDKDKNPTCAICGTEIDGLAAYKARAAKCGGCGTEYFPEG